jgi:glycosyltransferase involved in cell wall biosynthesis
MPATAPTPAAPAPFHLIYLGRSRLHRNRANLIQTLHMVAAFERIGARTTLYLPAWHRSLVIEQRLQDLGVRTALDVRPTSLLRSPWRYRAFIGLHRAALRAAGAIYTRSPDISRALTAARLRHHLEIHEAGYLADRGRLAAIVDAHRAGTIDRLIPISRSAAVVLITAGAVAERVHISPSGMDLEAYTAIAAFDPAGLDRPRVTYLGRISADRGARVLHAIAARGLAEITLIGDQEGSLSGGPSLRILPPVPHRDVASWYARTDLVLLPYQRELPHAESISPLKLFEALAAGRPIIASDLPPIREIIEHERTGLLVPPDDIDAWIAAIERLRSDRLLATRLAGGARVEAARFSWRRRAEDIGRALGWRTVAPSIGP